MLSMHLTQMTILLEGGAVFAMKEVELPYNKWGTGSTHLVL